MGPAVVLTGELTDGLAGEGRSWARVTDASLPARETRTARGREASRPRPECRVPAGTQPGGTARGGRGAGSGPGTRPAASPGKAPPPRGGRRAAPAPSA